jgi:hypothetical protein
MTSPGRKGKNYWSLQRGFKQNVMVNRNSFAAAWLSVGKTLNVHL